IEEFVAHSTNVNCLSIGKKAGRLFVTGGDDHQVNLWAIGKPTSLMSLCGHTSPVESVAFDTAEVLVLAGASAGAIKLWDLEEAKMVRTLTGHKSNCNAVEFHPFGEFFASGSTDTNLRVWDIRKKGCIHTYKGHTRGISTIKFSPDGRWVVSGGSDNVVKVWDLTAGKLLHDFKYHEGPIRSLDFHPLEFLLATGSADRTVKFWDLETFELIGSARPEATGVRSIAFHPDGRTLFCGLDESLKVYSWEPVICHDTVDMGWSTLGDLCIQEGKLLGCSYYRNSVGVWVADITLIEPYGTGDVPEEDDCTEPMFNISKTHSRDVNSIAGSRSRSPDIDTKEIKTIYVDSTGGNPVPVQRAGSLNSTEVVFPSDSAEEFHPTEEKPSPFVELNTKSGDQTLPKSHIVPAVVPREEKGSVDSRKETITFSRTKPGMLLRPVRRASKHETVEHSPNPEPVKLGNITSVKEHAAEVPLETKIVYEEGALKSHEENNSVATSVAQKPEKVLSPGKSSISDNRVEPANIKTVESLKNINGGDEPAKFKRMNSVKIVNGVAVVEGRTRSLVERFERREKPSNEVQSASLDISVPETIKEDTITPDVTPQVAPETETTKPSIETQFDNGDNSVPETIKTATVTPDTMTPCESPETDGDPERPSDEEQSANEDNSIPETIEADTTTPDITPEADISLLTPTAPITASPAVPESDKAPIRIRRSSSHGRNLPASSSLTEIHGRPITPSQKASSAVPESDRAPTRVRRPSPSQIASPAARESDKTVLRIRRSSSHGMGIHRNPVTPTTTTSRAATEVARPHRRTSSVGTLPTAERSRTRYTSSATKFTPVPESEATPPVSLNRTYTHEKDASPFATVFKIPRDLPATDKATTPMSVLNLWKQKDEIQIYVKEPPISSDCEPNGTPEIEKSAVTAVNRIRRRVPAMDRTTPITKREPRESVSAEYGHSAASNTSRSSSRSSTPEMDRSAFITVQLPRRVDKTAPDANEEPQISGRDPSSSPNYEDMIEDLMENHDAFLSTLKSRLTKLQVIRHFWERNDIKGAINALRRLPNHSVGIDVQADVISVLIDKIEIITLDLCSSLFPVLVGLLTSKMERHANVSLEMLLKLVAVFGPTIRSTVSAPRPVGVNLHAEERIECCNQCFVELQKIQQILPSLVRKGGVLAKSARELNLVLQRP
ncbi:Katanin p80 WD40 repeat-containing subunit B1 homolog KTN80.2, partial [Linum perenne]